MVCGCSAVNSGLFLGSSLGCILGFVRLSFQAYTRRNAHSKLSETPCLPKIVSTHDTKPLCLENEHGGRRESGDGDASCSHFAAAHGVREAKGRGKASSRRTRATELSSAIASRNDAGQSPIEPLFSGNATCHPNSSRKVVVANLRVARLTSTWSRPRTLSEEFAMIGQLHGPTNDGGLSLG